jgi:hypothetical protein
LRLLAKREKKEKQLSGNISEGPGAHYHTSRQKDIWYASKKQPPPETAIEEAVSLEQSQVSVEQKCI